MAVAAFNDNVQDNISVIVTPVEPGAKASYMVVADGHGGDEIAALISEKFEAVFKSAILLEQIKAQYFSDSVDDKQLLDGLRSTIALAIARNPLEGDQLTHHINRILSQLIEQKDQLKSKAGVVKAAIDELTKLISLFSTEEKSLQTFNLSSFDENESGALKKALASIKQNLSMRFEEALVMSRSMFAKSDGTLSENIKALRPNLSKIQHDLELLNKLAQQVFNIRKQFDKQMSASFNQQEFAAYLYNDKEKKRIEEIETRMLAALSNYPSTTVDGILKEMKEVLAPKKEKATLFNFGLFKTNKLESIIENTRAEIDNFTPSMKKVNQ